MSSADDHLASAKAPLPPAVAWGDAQPHSHLVQFYENDGFLVDSLCQWFRDGLSAGDTCLYIGTDAHRVSLEKKLCAQGVIFDLFTRAERLLDRSHGGLGIGLTLVKRLVEMHGGRVEANSEGLGMGSEFEVHLPIIAGMARTPTTRRDDKSKTLGRMRVLVVEDNLDAAEALTMLLELYGHEASVVSNGLAAIEAARASAFDIALVDIGLPGIDGYEVARRLRLLPNAKTMTLVALTGYGQDSDKRRARSAGFDDHLTKPVKIERLQALLNRPR